jgi:hypothetical protein
VLANGVLKDSALKRQLIWDRRMTSTPPAPRHADITRIDLTKEANADDWFEQGFNGTTLAEEGSWNMGGITPLSCALLCPFKVGLAYRKKRRERLVPVVLTSKEEASTARNLGRHGVVHQIYIGQQQCRAQCCRHDTS